MTVTFDSQQYYGALEPHSKGVYVNFTSDDPDERLRARASSADQGPVLVP